MKVVDDGESCQRFVLCERLQQQEERMSALLRVALCCVGFVDAETVEHVHVTEFSPQLCTYDYLYRGQTY